MKQRATKAQSKKESASVVAPEYRAGYKVTKFTDADGRTRQTRGVDDAVARAMLRFAAAKNDFMLVAKANDLNYDAKAFRNPGLFRMSLGNTLRAMVRKGTPVRIGDIEVRSLRQRVALPKSS